MLTDGDELNPQRNDCITLVSIFLCIDTVLDKGNKVYYTDLEELKAMLEGSIWDARLVY